MLRPTEAEVKKTRGMKNGKTPGTDGFPVEFLRFSG